MLAVHEAIFDEPPGLHRERRILEAVLANFESDRGALVTVEDEPAGVCAVYATAGDWGPALPQPRLQGPALAALFAAQRCAPGALSLSRVKRPVSFSAAVWEALWTGALGAPAAGLLSLAIAPREAPPSILWLMQTSCSREWSSRDRDLIEESGALLARAADKALNGG